MEYEFVSIKDLMRVEYDKACNTRKDQNSKIKNLNEKFDIILEFKKHLEKEFEQVK